MTFRDRLNHLGFKSYEDYLQSEHWAKFKCRYRESGRPMSCAVCGQMPIELHHHTYQHLGCELPEDVDPLCANHHEHVHLILRKNDWSVAKTAAAIEFLRSQRKRPPKPPTLPAKVGVKWKQKMDAKELQKSQSRRERREARIYADKNLTEKEQKALIEQFKELQRRGLTHPEVPPKYRMRIGDENMIRFIKLLWQQGTTGQRNSPETASIR